MNKPEFFVTAGYGERNLRLFHFLKRSRSATGLRPQVRAVGTMNGSSPSRSRMRSLSRSVMSSGLWLLSARVGSMSSM